MVAPVSIQDSSFKEENMKYRYIKFIDKSLQDHKDEFITFVGKPSQDLIEELELISSTEKTGSYMEKTLYSTTVAALGEKGWELQFVTPCSIKFLSNGNPGKIANSYIFRKEG